MKTQWRILKIRCMTRHCLMKFQRNSESFLWRKSSELPYIWKTSDNSYRYARNNDKPASNAFMIGDSHTMQNIECFDQLYCICHSQSSCMFSRFLLSFTIRECVNQVQIFCHVLYMFLLQFCCCIFVLCPVFVLDPEFADKCSPSESSPIQKT